MCINTNSEQTASYYVHKHVAYQQRNGHIDTHLSEAARHARFTDSQEHSPTFTGPLFGAIDTSKWHSGRNYPESEVELLLRQLGSTSFDSIRESHEFKNIKNELENTLAEARVGL